ncbi:MAG: RNA polymerase sigma factor [Myxococcota bacterium]
MEVELEADLEPFVDLDSAVTAPRERSNQDWLRELRAGGAEQAAALQAMRGYLLRALPGALRAYGTVPEHLLEDVVQDALLRTLDQLDRFEGRSRFTTWVTTIAVRVALTELRRRRWQDVSLDEMTAGAEVVLPSSPDGAADPERQAAQREIVRVLHDVLDRELSERQRTAIVAELRGMPQEEIGRRLGSTRNAIYKLGHDARKKLKFALEASGFSADEIRSAFR